MYCRAWRVHLTPQLLPWVWTSSAHPQPDLTGRLACAAGGEGDACQRDSKGQLLYNMPARPVHGTSANTRVSMEHVVARVDVGINLYDLDDASYAVDRECEQVGRHGRACMGAQRR